MVLNDDSMDLWTRCFGGAGGAESRAETPEY